MAFRKRSNCYVLSSAIYWAVNFVHGQVRFIVICMAMCFLPADHTIFFDPASYNVTEGGTATVSLMVSTSLLSFPFSVSLSYMNSTAVEGDDYIGGVITVSFSAGQETATFNAPTIDDNIAELTENFVIEILSTSTSRVVPGTPDTALVDILDNDGMSGHCLSIAK